MTIASHVSAETLLGDGGNRKFPFTFRAWEGEVRVVITGPDDQAIDVTGLADIELNELGGVVTYPVAVDSTALAPGWRLTILRDMNFLQDKRLVNAARFDPLVIEQALDRLTATDQQLSESLSRTITLVEGATQTPAGLLDKIFAAENTAVNAAGAAAGSADASAASQAQAEHLAAEAGLCAQAAQPAGEAAASAEELARQWAENPKDVPVRGTNEFSAYHWAQRAGDYSRGLVPDATESIAGITRYGTAAEHLTGVNNVAAQPGHIRTMLFANAGAGPLLRADILPEQDSGYPLLGIDWSTRLTPAPGFIDVSQDNGPLLRSAYPKAWAEASAYHIVKTDAQWLACKAQYGFVPFFSSGDGTSTFRVPLLRKCFPRAADPSTNLAAGTAQGDAIRNIEGGSDISIYSNTTALWKLPTSNRSGAITALNSSSSQTVYSYMQGSAVSTNYGTGIKIDASLTVPTADENRPYAAVLIPYMKMYGAIAEASEANIAELIQQTNTRLDTARYEADNTYSTTETDTGRKWIGGKAIYRKLIATGTLPNTASKAIPTGITGMDSLIALYGAASSPAARLSLPFVAADSVNWVNILYTSANTLSITTGANFSAYTGYVILEYTKI